MISLTWYDILVIGVLLFFIMRGAVKGVVFQLASLAGIVLCFVFANGISQAAGPYVHLEPPLNHWVIFAGSYLGFTFICFMIARSLNDLLERNKLKDFDRHLGAVLGFVKGVALVLVMTFFVVTMSSSAREMLKKSYTGRYAAIIMDRLHPIMPDRLHDAVAAYIHLLDQDGLDLQHSHDDHVTPPASPFGNAATFPTGNSPTFPTNNPLPPPISNGSQNPPGSSLWSQLEGLFSTGSRKVVNDALNQSDPQTRSQIEQGLQALMNSVPPQDRAALQQQISQLSTNQLKQFLDTKLGSLANPVQPTGYGIPSVPSSGLPPVSPGNAAAQRASLMSSIAALYTPDPNIRLTIEQDITQRTAGVPDAVTIAALNDWLSDLRGGRPDPDPQTNAQQPVEIRLVRQLQVAGIRLEQLNPEVQQRLRAAQSLVGASPNSNPL